jgi:hypothetical protein
MTEYHIDAAAMRDKLNAVSPSLCLAKWHQVSINLPAGLTQSCYHPPAHQIPLSELAVSPSALHNTVFKIHERKQMIDGERPAGCAYCWKVEDAEGNHLSDRHYRSSEWWAAPEFDGVVTNDPGDGVTPRYVEVNFNQTCNLKCMYCSPHLSSSWEDEIRKFGPYKLRTGAHNNIEALEQRGMMPIKGAAKDNPYVTAFWDWWPTIYRKLRVFRMTGGEPLMDKNTFKVLDYVNEHPNGQLELSITSNFCPPDQKLFNKFIAKVQALEEVRIWEDKENFNENSQNNWYVAPAHKHFMVFVSVDGYGKQAEYMRTGLDFDQMLANVRTYLRETKYSSISFINTFTLLSIPSLRKFLEMILELRKEFGGRVQEDYVIQPPDNGDFKHPPVTIKKHQRIWFDIPILRYPPWFSIQNAGQWGIEQVKAVLTFMEENVQQDDYLDTFEGFKPYELLKVRRDLAIMEQALSADQLSTNKSTFYEFITEYDSRRNTEFMEVFPEMRKYYIDCMKTFTKG